ncbi:MAG: cobalamin-binding protein [Deltaproteobacteria bacterium]|nr:cobalamin-binding protein [Deltaproteobacteria bacterium]
MIPAFLHILHRRQGSFRRVSPGILLPVIFLALQLFLPIASARTLTDPVGRRVDVPASPRRVIALAPSLTEIIFLLNKGPRLKGVTRFSTTPEAARALPRVGSYVHLDLERIVALHPDLCLAIKDGNPKYIVARIEALGIPVYVVNPLNLQGIMTTIKGIGDLLNASTRAEEIVRNMERRIDRVRSRVARTHTRPRVFFQIDAEPMVSVGSRTSINELITLAGGTNVTAGKAPYPRLTWEKVLTLQPEIVIISSMAGGHTPQWLKGSWRKWPQIPAVRKGKIYLVDSDLFDRPTPHLVDGLETLLAIIHPEVAKKGKRTDER